VSTTDGYVFKIPRELEDKMNELMEMSNLRTKREIIAHALSTFEWMLEMAGEGKRVYAVKKKDDGEMERSEMAWPFFLMPKKKNKK